MVLKQERVQADGGTLTINARTGSIALDLAKADGWITIASQALALISKGT